MTFSITLLARNVYFLITIRIIISILYDDKIFSYENYIIFELKFLFSDMGRLFSSSSLPSLRLHLGDRTMM